MSYNAPIPYTDFSLPNFDCKGGSPQPPTLSSGSDIRAFLDDALGRDILLAEACRRSFFRFVVEFWNEISPDPPHWNWHIPYLCGEVMKVVSRVAAGQPKEYDLIINIPPGTTKSTIFSRMLNAWVWTRWHWIKFIYGSYSGSLSMEHAQDTRDIIRSEKYQRLFPELSLKKSKDAKSNFSIQKRLPVNPTKEDFRPGGSRYSTSVGGTLMGFHGHIQVVDDPLDPRRSISVAELQTSIDWIEQTLSGRKTDKEVTPLILIQQRLAEGDPTGHLLSKKGKRIKHICLPGEIKNYKDQLKPKELKKYYSKDGLLDPKRMSWNVLFEAEQDLGQYGYAGQIGQNPTPPAGGMFKVDRFQIVEQMPAAVSIMQTIRYWDKAGTKDGTGAQTAGVKIHKLANGKFLISDVKTGRWDAKEREDIIKSTTQTDGPLVKIYIEQEPGSGGKESAQSTILNLSGFACYADRPTGDKIYRADPYSVQVNNGNVQLLRGDWVSAFKEEHRLFPFGKLKDQVDAAAAGFNIMKSKKQVRIIH